MSPQTIKQERMERKLAVEEIRKNGVQLEAPEPSYSASIKEEIQQRTTTFTTPVQAAAAQAKKQLKHEQQVQEALRYFDQKKASASRQASPLTRLLDGKQTLSFFYDSP